MQKPDCDVELCESPRWDSGTYSACKYMGFRTCKLLDKPIHQDILGWKSCHADCPKPYRKLNGESYFRA